MTINTRSFALTFPGSKNVLEKGLIPTLIMAILLAMAVIEPRFYTRLNIANILGNFSLTAIAALGQMLVMIVGGFDLSIGAVIALASVVAATTMTAAIAIVPDHAALTVVLGVLAGLGSGGLVGALNGAVVAGLRVSPFMTTLGISSIVSGGVFYITKGIPIYGMPEEFATSLGRSTVFGLPLVLWVGLLIAFAVWVLLSKSAAGRHLLATGGNIHAARSSGIKVSRILLTAYGVSGFLAGLVGVLISARIGSGQSTLGATSAIESIAACVIGGVSLRGGVGHPWRVVLSALFLAIVANALNLARVDSKWQTAVLGLALLVAVAIEVDTSRGSSNE